LKGKEGRERRPQRLASRSVERMEIESGEKIGTHVQEPLEVNGGDLSDASGLDRIEYLLVDGVVLFEEGEERKVTRRGIVDSARLEGRKMNRETYTHSVVEKN